MFLRPASCPTCGAPIPEASIGRTFTTCEHCNAVFTPEGRAVFRAPYRRALEAAEARVAPRGIRLEERTFVPERVLSKTKNALVLLAHAEVPLVERVVLKLSRSEDHLQRERTALTALAAAHIAGHSHFSTRVPQIVARGVAELEGTPTWALAVRAPSALHTLVDVAAAFPGGVDGRHAVWIWRRVLETLGFAHRVGWTHHRITADHLVVSARDHGVLVVGWSGAERDADPRADLVATAETLAAVSAPLPEPLATLLRASRGGAHVDAWQLGEAVGHAARQAYGPPAFHALTLPPFHR